MAKARKVRPAHLPFGRWLGDFEPLGPAERKLVACCARGEECKLGDERPDTSTAANTVRAGLIRFLALGGDTENPMHEQGIYLTGARIIDRLDLDGAKASCSLLLHYCRLEEKFLAPDAELPGLSLGGSEIPGLDASRIVVKSGVFLNDGFKATGEVRFTGAQIGGDLYCVNGSFDRGDQDDQSTGHALNADSAAIAGDLYLSDGFSAKGEVRLLGARISGGLYCSKGKFGRTDDSGNPVGTALSADGMNVGGGFFLRSGEFSGRIDLTEVHIGSLVDGYSPSPESDDACWPAGQLILDGFRYDRIGAGPAGAARRIAWLKKQIPEHLGIDFRPQPWEQLIKVLRETGHPDEARRIAIAKQDVITLNAQGKWRTLRRKAFKYAASYGYEPWRLVIGAVIAWLGFALLFYLLGVGQVACTSDLWCAGNGLRPLAYSLDVILPIDFGLADKGVPGEAINLLRLPTGTAVRVLTGVETTLGWVLAGVLAAIAGGLVKKD